ncbi:uncharacterized protein B0H18DRAFT_984732 [Fomitopsis serialis]|uniref:uncharacterized protein n=1 Tax=Fomitopsis serialis TaxID=139415 RepID=UPI002008190A|nr:uncharacterized protein B0H18DRAFT_1040169 [Neoantrodia serialis]XP_047897571.1 uncharacterized protein B0H18DRAFT_984732 [Neoantrodia serialis]KAH9915849.1 hypothetical protein B0H18DRAFT_1040169 [Neoantrodia serialis]KAH9932936.1 hypothetical protein B0H18DRAFT_984732 [Neoantrodia serialis]
MASGFGFNGGVPRCFPYWQEFQKCYAQTDVPAKCRPPLDDYVECLHHTNEIARAKTIKAEFIRKAEHEATEGRKAADIIADGAIVGVGLIKRSQEEGESK